MINGAPNHQTEEKQRRVVPLFFLAGIISLVVSTAYVDTPHSGHEVISINNTCYKCQPIVTLGQCTARFQPQLQKVTFIDGTSSICHVQDTVKKCKNRTKKLKS